MGKRAKWTNSYWYNFFQMGYMAVLALQTVIIFIGNGCDGRLGEYRMFPGAIVENSGLVHLVDKKIEVVITLNPLKSVADTLGRHAGTLKAIKQQIAKDTALNEMQKE